MSGAHTCSFIKLPSKMPRDPSLFATSNEKSPRLGLMIPGVKLSQDTPEVVDELLRLWNYIVKEYIEIQVADMAPSEIEAKSRFPVPLDLELKPGENGKPLINSSLGIQKMGLIVKTFRDDKELRYGLYAHSAKPAGRQLTLAVERIAATQQRHFGENSKRMEIRVAMLEKMRELRKELAAANVAYVIPPQLIGEEQVVKPMSSDYCPVTLKVENERFREPIKFTTGLLCTWGPDFN
jgi:hypothetical protein